MTYHIILVLCIIVILSYVFDITAKYSKIPGVILLIALGIAIQYILKPFNIEIPNLRPVLPVIGTLGLIMIVMEASLDLKLERRKRVLILKSVTSAILLFCIFVAVFTWILTEFYGVPLKDALLNAMPPGIISSSIAIPATVFLKPDDKEFVVYESSFSDIFGILVFDFILVSQDSFGSGILHLAGNSIITVVIAILTTAVLAMLLHKTAYHVHYVIIMTSVVLVYMLAKLAHLPSLLLIMIFGLILSNNHFLENTPITKFVDFHKFRNDIKSFQVILTELTFLVRSFFFIMFGFYTKVEGLFNVNNILTATAITTGIFLLRLIFMKQALRMNLLPLFFYSPRGLITILLFLSIPLSSRISLIPEEVITLVILFSILILMVGSIVYKKDKKIKAREVEPAGNANQAHA